MSKAQEVGERAADTIRRLNDECNRLRRRIVEWEGYEVDPASISNGQNETWFALMEDLREEGLVECTMGQTTTLWVTYKPVDV